MKMPKFFRLGQNATEAPLYTFTLNAPVSGEIINLSEVNDPTFSERILGDGYAVRPTDGIIISPANAVIESVAKTGHAVSMTTDSGAEILIHVGVDTVELDGHGFDTAVSVGEHVKMGDILIKADIDFIQKSGYDTVTPIIVTNIESYSSVSAISEKAVAGMPFLLLEPKVKR